MREASPSPLAARADQKVGAVEVVVEIEVAAAGEQELHGYKMVQLCCNGACNSGANSVGVGRPQIRVRAP